MDYLKVTAEPGPCGLALIVKTVKSTLTLGISVEQGRALVTEIETAIARNAERAAAMDCILQTSVEMGVYDKRAPGDAD